jgi:hypothetical protein
MIDCPHFDFPFRLGSDGHVIVVEQDDPKDVQNCVLAIALTLKGQRAELPDFGITDPTFQKQPIDLNALLAAITEQEPRAAALAEQAPDQFNQMMANVILQISSHEGERTIE